MRALLLLGLLGFGALAHADDRDDAIFGESSAPAEVATDALEDPLTVGGFTYLRMNAFAEGPTDLDEAFLLTPALMDLYGDARPHPRVRGYGRWRMEQNLAGGDLQLSLDQLWVKTDVAQTLFLTVGKQPLRWGVGRFWNPGDWLNTTPRDPFSPFDQRLGLPLIKLHLPLERLGWNFYGVADLAGATAPEQVGGVVRAEFLVGLTEASATLAARKDAPWRGGLDVSSGLGLVDARLEVAAREGQSEPAVVAGADASFNRSEEDTVTFGLEAFHNPAGSEDPSGYDGLPPLYMGQRYVAASVIWPRPWSFDDSMWIASALTNLSDQTGLVRLDWRWTAHQHLRCEVWSAFLLGDEGEFARSLLPGTPIPRVMLGLGVRLAM